MRSALKHIFPALIFSVLAATLSVPCQILRAAEEESVPAESTDAYSPEDIRRSLQQQFRRLHDRDPGEHEMDLALSLLVAQFRDSVSDALRIEDLLRNDRISINGITAGLGSGWRLYPDDLQGRVLSRHGASSEINIGYQDGVKIGSVFHVTRDDEVVGWIVIHHVETEVAVGTNYPAGPSEDADIQAGDDISTSLNASLFDHDVVKVFQAEETIALRTLRLIEWMNIEGITEEEITQIKRNAKVSMDSAIAGAAAMAGRPVTADTHLALAWPVEISVGSPDDHSQPDDTRE